MDALVNVCNTVLDSKGLEGSSLCTSGAWTNTNKLYTSMVDQGSTASALLMFGAAQFCVFGGPVLGTVGCLAASLEPTH